MGDLLTVNRSTPAQLILTAEAASFQARLTENSCQSVALVVQMPAPPPWGSNNRPSAKLLDDSTALAGSSNYARQTPVFDGASLGKFWRNTAKVVAAFVVVFT